MPDTLTVALGARSYPIHIGAGSLAEAGPLIRPCLAAPRALVIADDRVHGLHGAALMASLAAAGIAAEVATFPAGEPSKTATTAASLWEACARARLGRDGAVVAFGGGVAGDLAGFVAATWMRGIRFVQVPTTLLAMVDSSVGGKTGVDLPAGKNLVGAFHQPSCVIADPLLLATMDRRAYRSGLAEVLKYGVIRDAAFLAWQERSAEALAAGDPAAVARAVYESCRIKAWYVATDETEQGPRAELNYGHTFGHALEAHAGYDAYHHGEAVGIGMRMAIDLARRTGLLEDADLPRRQDELLRRYQLPLAHRCADPAAEAAALAARTGLDKKAVGGRARFILPRRAGVIERRAVDDQAVVEAAFAAGCVAG